ARLRQQGPLVHVSRPNARINPPPGASGEPLRKGSAGHGREAGFRGSSERSQLAWSHERKAGQVVLTRSGPHPSMVTDRSLGRFRFHEIPERRLAIRRAVGRALTGGLEPLDSWLEECCE